MADSLTIGGGEDDLCRLLIARNLVAQSTLEKIVRERRTLQAIGAGLPPLNEVLVRSGLLASALVLEALESETQALATCAACGAFHRVRLFNPGRAYACANCRKPLKPKAQSSAPTAPVTLESLAGLPGGQAGETLLDMGSPVRRAPPPAAKNSLPEQESLLGRVPLGSGETILDMNPLRPAAPPPLPDQESLLGSVPPGGGDTMLDMGTISPKAPPPPAAPAAEPTIVLGGAGESSGSVDPTVVLGETPRTTSTGSTKSASRSRSVAPDETPRTSTGGRSYAPLKSAPKEVIDAAKEAQRVFGKYILLKELGRGGAGVVYKAWDTTLAQFVALKFLRDQDPGDSETSTGSQAVMDFQREARMSAKLRHPNIIRIYEMGSMSNRFYLSMDYIEGGSLLEVIHGGKERNSDTLYNSDPKKFLGIMRMICEALHTAHSNNPPVVHRDVKPHNVLVDKTGNPYVVDFGLAKEVEMSTSQNTVTGAVKGTPSYMAPEQAEGRNKDVDARTDVYSLGAVLYEMLTGRPPFVGGNVRIVLNAIVTQLPERPNIAIQTALLENPEGPNRPRPVPRPLETICMKALEKAPADRYQTALELAEDIKRFLNDEDISAQEPGFWRRVRRQMRQHPLITGAAAAAVLCLGVILGAFYYTSKIDTSGLDKLEAIAREHLGAKDWAAMKADSDNLRRIKPKHGLIQEIDKALAAHETDLKNRRIRWEAGLAALAAEGPAALEKLRPAYQSAGELHQEFSDQLQRALLDVQSAAENAARELVAGGPGESWLKPEVKTSARALRERLLKLQALGGDPDFAFKAGPQGAVLRDGLSRLLEYEGLWTLRVNVAPFAKVVLRRGGKVIADEWTPLGVRDLEVAGEYKIELAWTGAGTADKIVKLDLKDLKHGATVVLGGDMTKSDVRVLR